MPDSVYSVHLEASNKTDWIVQFGATDIETGEDIDFTGADVSFKVKDDRDCVKLSAVIGDGLTLVSSDVLELQFTPDQMCGLCPGTYRIGAIFELNGETNQLLVGTVAIYDGVAKL